MRFVLREVDPVRIACALYVDIFRGIPMTQQSTFNTLPSMPNQVAIFRGPILRVTRGRRDAVEQIRETVIHELGHYFGLDEDRLAELGYE